MRKGRGLAEVGEEASVLGICAFRKHELTPAGLTELEVEVHSSVRHTLSVRKVHDRLQGGVRTPKERLTEDHDVGVIPDARKFGYQEWTIQNLQRYFAGC